MLLPFILLVLAILVNLGYAAMWHIEARTAARYAGMYHVRALALESTRGQATSLATRELKRHYPGFQVTFSSAGFFKEPLGALGDRSQTRVTRFRKAPLANFLPGTAVGSRFVVDGVTWTYDDLPIDIFNFPEAVKRIGVALARILGVSGSFLSVVSGLLSLLSGTFRLVSFPIYSLLGLKP